MPEWGQVFSASLPIAELVVRGTVVFLVVLALMRLVGQREAGALGVTDVLVIVLVAEATAPALYGSADSILDSIVLVVTILFWSVAIDAVGYRWPRLGRVLKATPRPLVEDGRLNHKVMRRELISAEEVESILRLEGIDDIRTVHRAQIEPNGMVSIIRNDGGTSKAPEPPPEL